MKSLLPLLAALFLGWTQPAEAQAECLYIDFNGSFPQFVNNCSHGVDFDFTDRDTCSGWRCSGYVGPFSRFSVQLLSGTVRWFACRSDGIGEVIAICDNSGRCSCN